MFPTEKCTKNLKLLDGLNSKYASIIKFSELQEKLVKITESEKDRK